MAPVESYSSAAPAWKGAFHSAYRIENETGHKMTMFQYDIPLPTEQEAVTFARFGIEPEVRGEYYQQVAKCVHRNVSISNLLRSNSVPSILTFEKVSQERNPKTGTTSIRLYSQEVWPIMDKLFQDEIPLLTLLDVFIRLSVIVRDMAKPPCEVSHRGISMDNVYLTADNKILLGGFYFSTAPSAPEISPYFHDKDRHLPPSLRNGASGSAATDMQTLSRILYNFCSGLPWDSEWASTPNIFPEYAPDALAQVIRFGMNCSVADCNIFRRKLLDCRKALSKTDAAQIYVPVSTPLRDQFMYRSEDVTT